MQPLLKRLRRPRRTMRLVAGGLALLALLIGIAGGALANATPAATPAATPQALTGCRPTAPTLPWPVLRQGSRGADVTALQYMLRGWSGNRLSLAADGRYGPQT